MNYKQLSDSVRKGQRYAVYLLHGQEEYVKDRLYEQLYELLAPQTLPEFNVHVLHAPTDEQIIAACMTPPMMAEEKLVVVRDCPLLGGDEEQKTSAGALRAQTDRLTEYLETLPEGTRLIFLQRGKVSGGNRLKKYLAKNAQEVLVDPLDQADAQSWILARMRRMGFEMEREAAAMLYYYVGPAMGDVAGEMEKLALYAQGRGTITAQDVQRVAEDRSSVRIFTLTDHLGMGRIQKAYEALESVRRGDADAFQILYMTARQYRLIARLCQLQKENLSPAQIKKELGVQDFVYRSLEQQARLTGLSRAMQALEILLDAEDGIKTGRYRDEEFVVDASIAMIAALYSKA